MSPRMIRPGGGVGAALPERSGSFIPDLLRRDAARRSAEDQRLAEAVQLLEEHCDQWQALCLLRGYLVAQGSSSNDVYYVCGNVVCRHSRLGGWASYCVHAYGEPASPAEQTLAVKLMLESNEPQFLRIANYDRRLTAAERVLIAGRVRDVVALLDDLTQPGVTQLETSIAAYRFARRLDLTR